MSARPGSCFHFRGIQHATCLAGIKMIDVRDDSQPGPYRWPCITIAGREPATTTCASFREPTKEEIAAWDAKVEARLKEIADRHERGLCADCGAKITRARQVGRCAYAEPCGHRIGQGSADAINKRLGL